MPPPGEAPEEVISEDTLRAMTPEELRGLCRNNNVTVPDDVADENLLDWLLAEFGV